MITFNCKHCGKETTSLDRDAKYCSHACVNKARTVPFADRFWSFVEFIPFVTCWIWNGRIDNRIYQGYGRFEDKPAHFVAWELLRGPVPEGLELDHKCRVHRCVNPDHLEPVTHRENIMRGESPSAKNARKILCKRGHELTPNPYRLGQRRCETCTRETMAKWNAMVSEQRKQKRQTAHLLPRPEWREPIPLKERQ